MSSSQLRLLAVAAAAAALVTGCGGGGAGGASGRDRLAVVATTTQVADLVANVGGARVAVDRLLAPNTDPHEYEVRPDDVRGLAGAKLIVRSGGEVDAWLQSAIDASGSDARVVTLIDHVAVRREGADVDPHWWQDPRDAERAVAAIRDALAAADPAGAAAYRSAATAYTRRIAALDAAVARCLERVPAAARTLVTTHDALGYYARRYRIRVVGAVIPSLSTAGQASAGETAALVQAIRGARVSAIFAESSVNPKVERAIAAEAGARVGAALWADTLGPPGSSGSTYLRSIAANTRALVDGFTDGQLRCALPA
jgi:zinc/manganese transport system substrate-binding protein/manganese/iron transport system substrate-binding protein